jgi:hypothetical protein
MAIKLSDSTNYNSIALADKIPFLKVDGADIDNGQISFQNLMVKVNENIPAPSSGIEFIATRMSDGVEDTFSIVENFSNFVPTDPVRRENTFFATFTNQGSIEYKQSLLITMNVDPTLLVVGTRTRVIEAEIRIETYINNGEEESLISSKTFLEHFFVAAESNIKSKRCENEISIMFTTQPEVQYIVYHKIVVVKFRSINDLTTYNAITPQGLTITVTEQLSGLVNTKIYS